MTTARSIESGSGAATSRRVVRTVRGVAASDGAGVRLTRVIGGQALADLDPFLLLDEFRSDDAGDYIGGFPDHPHRGFETVTYMLAGRMRHGDNQGNSGLLGPGSVQWMTAARGIVHSEMPEQEDGLMWGFQLWVNLPSRDKMSAPRYQDIAPERIPALTPAEGVRVRLIAGRIGEAEGPVRAVATEPVYVDVTLAPGARYDVALPSGHQAFAYVFENAVEIGPQGEARTIQRGELAVLGAGGRVELAGGAQGGRLILVAGKPLHEPVARYGPFVMNTQAEIIQAFEDFRSGRF
jgi:redox-sensitive bicupin YhaK (pirin superfamily)